MARKDAEAVILEYIEKIMPGGPTVQIYKDRFAEMNDAAFAEFMQRLESGQERLVMIAPSLDKKNQLLLERNFEIAEELGHDFYQRIWMAPGKGVPTYLTPKKYLVLQLPLRRQAQLQDKKARIPKDNRSIDDLTGQPSGASKGSKISYPETQVMAALNLPHSLAEMLKGRGGDVKAFDAMNAAIDRQGGVSMKSIEHLAGGVESTKAVSTYLKAMHIDSTL